MVFSASAVTAREQYGNGYHFLLRQLLWLALGLAGMLALMNLDYRKLREPQFVFPFLFAVLLMLVGVFLPRQVARHASLVSPGPGQPAALRTRQARRDSLSGVVSRDAQPPAQFWRERLCGTRWLRRWASCLLMLGLVLLEPDLGTALEIFMIAFGMLFVAGLSEKYILAPGAAAVPGVYLAIVHVSYRYERVMAFLHPDADPQGRGFQLMQSLIAVGSGGFTGVGLMESKQKLFYLPEAHTDFIFAVLVRGAGLHRRRDRAGACLRSTPGAGCAPRFAPRTTSAASWRWASR